MAAAALSRLTAQEGLTLSDTLKPGFFVLCKYIAVTGLGMEAENCITVKVWTEYHRTALHPGVRNTAVPR